MQVIIPDGTQRHPRCLRAEYRAYATRRDARRAATLFRRHGNRVVDYIDCGRPALAISRWAIGPDAPREWQVMTRAGRVIANVPAGYEPVATAR